MLFRLTVRRGSSGLDASWELNGSYLGSNPFQSQRSCVLTQGYSLIEGRLLPRSVHTFQRIVYGGSRMTFVFFQLVNG
jgi:hypothetical protein